MGESLERRAKKTDRPVCCLAFFVVMNADFQSVSAEILLTQVLAFFPCYFVYVGGSRGELHIFGRTNEPGLGGSVRGKVLALATNNW